MAHYRKIDVRIWNDEKFCGLSDDGKLCFLFILTHPHLTALGAMRATVGGLADELHWTPARFARAWAGVCPTLVQHDDRASCLWVPKFLHYNQPESPNVVRAWAKALDAIPECRLRRSAVATAAEVCESMRKGKAKGFLKAFHEAFRQVLHDDLLKACAEPSPYQEQEQKQEQKDQGSSTDDSGVRGAVSSSSEPVGRFMPAAMEFHAAWVTALPGSVPPWAQLQPQGRRTIAKFVRDVGSLDAAEAFLARVVASDYLAGRLDLPPIPMLDAFAKYDRIMGGSFDNRPRRQARHDAALEHSLALIHATGGTQ